MRGRSIGVFVGVAMTVSCAAAPPSGTQSAAPDPSTTESSAIAPGSTDRWAGVCAGIAHCRVVADRDVDGDGDRDKVAWVQRSQKRVVIRVRTADGATLRHRVDVSLWYRGGAWAGAAPIDGRRGAELLVGSTMGAHTPGYTVLTYRRGGLQVLDSPRRENHWYIDGAYSVAAGWWRNTNGETVRMTYKDALRTRRDTFRGANTTYAWHAGRWVQRATVKTFYRTDDAAFKIIGWHVRGLAKFPGI